MNESKTSINNTSSGESDNIVTNLGSKKSKSNTLGKIITSLIAVSFSVFLIISIFFSTSLFSASNNLIGNIFPDQNIFDVFKSFVGLDTANIKGSQNGRTNILIIGKDYGLNTDTIIVLSYFHKNGQISSVSLPRDLRVDDGYGQKKINSIYADATERVNGNNSTQPEQFLSSTIGKFLNSEIHYWAKIDIEGFSKIIDTIDGIDIDVDNAFTDCEFPTPNYAPVYYPNLKQRLPYIRPCPKFETGMQNMNSERALIYARSRKSFDNPLEAIDFARNQRQQKVIEAVIEKLKKEISSGKFLLDPKKLEELSNAFSNNIKTSISVNELISLIKKLPAGKITLNRYALDFDSGIICNAKDGSSNITLCDNTSMSISRFGTKQRELQEVFKNLGEDKKISPSLQSSKILLTGNGSAAITKTLNELKQKGFEKQNITLNNVNTKIKLPTAKSVEKAYIYIEDSSIKQEFEKLNLNIYDVEINYIDKLPTNLLAPTDEVKNINIFVY